MLYSTELTRHIGPAGMIRTFLSIDYKSIADPYWRPQDVGASEGSRSLNPLRATVFKTVLYTNSNTLAYIFDWTTGLSPVGEEVIQRCASIERRHF